jgi:hypothetical protein
VLITVCNNLLDLLGTNLLNLFFFSSGCDGRATGLLIFAVFVRGRTSKGLGRRQQFTTKLGLTVVTLAIRLLSFLALSSCVVENSDENAASSFMS